MEISSKIEHKMVFIAFSSPGGKKGFLSISFHSFWLLAEMVFSILVLEIHKARFLVKSATGGRQSNIA